MTSRAGEPYHGALGFNKQTLLGFGLKPRRPRRKKTPADTRQQEPAAQQ